MPLHSTCCPRRCGRHLHPREGLFLCLLASRVPSEGSYEPERHSEGKIAGGMTNGFDFKEGCFQTEEGRASCSLAGPPSAES